MINVPETIDQWLQERIEFCLNLVGRKNTSKKMEQYRFIVLENYKYCQKLFHLLKTDETNKELKSRFKNIASKLIFDTIYELDKQDYECVCIEGQFFPTTEREIMSQERVDDSQKLRNALEQIFEQVQKI